jgi:hypothetical protein
MAAVAHIRRTLSLVLLIAFTAAVQTGCREPEQIRSYSVPKEAKPPVAETPPPVKPGEATDRMLAGIIPADGQAWFFKLVGPIPTIDKLEKPFDEFVTAVRIDGGKPKWQLPASWKEGPAGNAMRYATILVPNEPKPLELTVNSLPWSGTPQDMLANVNRWRSQLQLQPAEAAQIASFTREVKAGERTATIVDLRGRSGGGGMMPPFAGGAAPFAGGTPPFAGDPVGPASRAGQTAPPSNLPPGHPPLESNAAAPAAEKNSPPADAPAADVPKFDAPSDWKQIPAAGMRKAAFAIGDGEKGAEVTLTNFHANAGPMIGDVLQNVNMWRQGVGLAPIQTDELAKYTESIEIDGKKATYARAVPDPSQSDQSKASRATIAAMVTDGDQLWFVKLFGDRSAVVAQEEAFKTFLKSLRFGDGGATDGHK